MICRKIANELVHHSHRSVHVFFGLLEAFVIVDVTVSNEPSSTAEKMMLRVHGRHHFAKSLDSM